MDVPQLISADVPCPSPPRLSGVLIARPPPPRRTGTRRSCTVCTSPRTTGRWTGTSRRWTTARRWPSSASTCWPWSRPSRPRSPCESGRSIEVTVRFGVREVNRGHSVSRGGQPSSQCESGRRGGQPRSPCESERSNEVAV